MAIDFKFNLFCRRHPSDIYENIENLMVMVNRCLDFQLLISDKFLNVNLEQGKSTKRKRNKKMKKRKAL